MIRFLIATYSKVSKPCDLYSNYLFTLEFYRHLSSYAARQPVKSHSDMVIKTTNLLASETLPGPIFCLLLGVSSDCAQPITGQVTSVLVWAIEEALCEGPSQYPIRRLTGRSGPIFCLLLGVSSDCAQPITGQVTSVTWPVIGWA